MGITIETEGYKMGARRETDGNGSVSNGNKRQNEKGVKCELWRNRGVQNGSYGQAFRWSRPCNHLLRMLVTVLEPIFFNFAAHFERQTAIANVSKFCARFASKPSDGAVPIDTFHEWQCKRLKVYARSGSSRCHCAPCASHWHCNCLEVCAPFAIKPFAGAVPGDSFHECLFLRWLVAFPIPWPACGTRCQLRATSRVSHLERKRGA